MLTKQRIRRRRWGALAVLGAVGTAAWPVISFFLQNPDKDQAYLGWIAPIVAPIVDKLLHSKPLSATQAYARLLSIVSGDNTKPLADCAADSAGSNVQLFKNGLLLIRHGKTTIYAITGVNAQDNKISWIKRFDKSNGSGNDVPCPGIDGEKLLGGGFRWLYCDEASTELRRELGPPRTSEIPVWAQFQEWPGGLLIYGIPQKDVARYREHVNPDTEIQAFTGLWGFFLDLEQRDSGVGREMTVTPNNTLRKVYCASLWYPRTNDPLPKEMEKLDEKECPMKDRVSGVTYVQPRKNCSIFGLSDD
jgi:hypothetical protein